MVEASLSLAKLLLQNLVSWAEKIPMIKDYKPWGIALVFVNKKEKNYFSLTYDVENEKFAYKHKKINLEFDDEQG